MQAYGTLTIVDLLDTATYIYYADNAEGDNPSATSEGKTHIGIYGGPALSSRPDLPDPNWSSDVWSGWQKYVGEDGAPGTSITIKSTQVKYIVTEEDAQPSTAANWGDSIPTTPQGSYLWTWTKVVYSDDSSTDTFSKSYLGKDANAYYIETNQEEVLIFKTSQGNQTSPAILKIKMYKLPLTSNSKPIDFSKNYRFGYIDGDGVFNDLITEKYAEYYENNETSNVFSYSIQDLINKYTDTIPTNTVLKFAYLENNEEIAIKIIPYQFGTSEDMAKFAVTAASINAAVGKSTLEFDADGLTIRNGHFEIIDNKDVSLLQYTPPSGKEGSGLLEITGKIHATDGEFNGKINAIEGDIGGFIIDNDGLYSKSGAGAEGNYNTSNSNIRLLGGKGEIYAKNITLGTSAQIEEYIQLGNAFLRNPDKAEGKLLLEAGEIKLNDEGVLQLGTTKLDGKTSTITGNNWSITPDHANFKNINVSGKISTAVFEQSHIQSVGGSMIFKPSYKVEGYEPGKNGNGDTLILDREFSGKIDEINEEGQVVNRNYIYLVKTDGTLVEGQISITGKDDEKKTVVISSNLNLNSQSENNSNPLVSLIDIGTKGSLIIGVNSNGVEAGLLRPYGFTITEYNVLSNAEANIEPNAESNTDSDTGSNINSFQNPKVFFGDLKESGIKITDTQGLEGFGLYSENVYLTGSLTTQINKDSRLTYAGINTLNSVSATKFDQNTGAAIDNSKIVFWAGATNMTDINNAPFQVTEQGSLYAAQGLFEGAIISKSRIQGVDIYAARIHGWDIEKNETNSLTFYNASKGIVFKKGDYNGVNEDKSTEIFSIGEEGLSSNNKYFIDITNGKIKFISDEIQTSDYFTNKTGTSFLHLKDNQILGSYIVDNTSEKVHANISFNDQKLSFGLNKTQEDFVINSNEIQLKKDTVKINKTVLFGEQLKYEQTANGYNLYVL